MLYNWCLQFILSLLELPSRTHLHSFNANYLILSSSSPGFIFHSYSLGKFISSAVPLMLLGKVIWKVFCPGLLLTALKEGGMWVGMWLSKSPWSTMSSVCTNEQAPAREIPEFLRHIQRGDGAWHEQELSVSPQILQVSELEGPQQEWAAPGLLPVPVCGFDDPKAVP